MESMAQAEADWNCRKCGAPIAALDEATILFAQIRVGAVLRSFPRRWHQTCYETQVLLAMLRKICDRASVPFDTTSGIPIVKIPAALIDQAREAIAKAEGK